MPDGIIIAAPSSGSGKTTITLALLRYCRNNAIDVRSFKAGPDFIDPAFHHAASGKPCYNLDAWAMPENMIADLIGNDQSVCIAEGVMGLFDGANNNLGSTAHLAELTHWPVVLVVDCWGMAGSVAALIQGFSNFRKNVNVVGVIFNKVGSSKHAAILRDACTDVDITVLGYLPRDDTLWLPDRHLGLVQANEHPTLDTFLDKAAGQIANFVDVEKLLSLSSPCGLDRSDYTETILKLGTHIGIAQDAAFSFIYPAFEKSWCEQGATLEYFSPLSNQAPSRDCDAIFLPGGYPELHAETLANNQNFCQGMKKAADNHVFIYGECGGYMTLGHTLVDKHGKAHKMLDLLPVNTSYAKPKMTLGYRSLQVLATLPFTTKQQTLKAHEFHFSSGDESQSTQPLFLATDSNGNQLGEIGACRGNVFGSYAHLIC